ncbi:MAG: DUF4091 domain-containing protein [Phycisphaeraceae bacterium]
MHRLTFPLTLLLLTLLAAPALAFEGEVVGEWSFNDQQRTESQWEGWASPNTTAEFNWVADGGRDGTGAVHIQSDGPKSALWRIDVPVVGGTTYEFSAWIRLRNGQGFTGLAGRTIDENGDWISGGNFRSENEDIFLRGDSDWRQLRVQFHTPTHARTIALFLVNRLGDGDEVWFDDVVLKEAVGPMVRNLGPQLATEATDAAATLREADQLPDEMGERAEDYATRIAGQIEQLEAAQEVAPHIRIRRAAWDTLREGVQLQRQLERQAQFVRFQESADGPVGTAWIDSTQRAFIDDLPLGEHTEQGRIELFGGEHQAAQLVLIPFESIEDAAVRVRPKGETANGITADDIDWRVVGYVQIEQPAINAAGVDAFPYAGWWPDPLLEVEHVALTPGDYQPIWIDVHAPRDSQVGEAAFDIEIIESTDDDQPRVLATSTLTVERLPGELPEQWHLEKMLSFSQRLASEGWPPHKTQITYGDRWDEVADQFYDLLLDYRIGLGSLYEPLDAYSDDVLLRAEEAGQNMFFTSAGRVRNDGEGNYFLGEKDKRTINHALGPVADKMESLGLLDKTYFYSFDEHWPWTFSVAREVFERAKQRGLTTISTLHDETYGTDSILGDVLDIYVDGHVQYDTALARKARAEGRKVWWYSTSDFNIETDVFYQRHRLWRTMAVEADGYLIWAMNRWVGNDAFIGKQVRTDWNPYLDGATPSSSAMMIYPGEHGPVSSLRLENFRTGVQDYDLLAETALRRKQPDESFYQATDRLLTQLGVPENGEGMNSRDLRRFRRELATILDKMEDQQ